MSDKSRIEAGMDWAKEKVGEMTSNAKYEADKSKMVCNNYFPPLPLLSHCSSLAPSFSVTSSSRRLSFSGLSHCLFFSLTAKLQQHHWWESWWRCWRCEGQICRNGAQGQQGSQQATSYTLSIRKQTPHFFSFKNLVYSINNTCFPQTTVLICFNIFLSSLFLFGTLSRSQSVSSIPQ